MDKKTTGLVATIATALLCGCPGLFMCLFGAITAAGAGTFNDTGLSPAVGFVLICLSLIFIAIPIVVGVVTLRKPKEESSAVVDVKPTEEPTPVAETPAATPEPPKPPAPPSEKPAEPVDDEPLPPAS